MYNKNNSNFYITYIGDFFYLFISIFKGVFDFKNQTFKIRYNLVVPILFLIIIGMLVLSSKTDFSNFYDSSFYKQLIWLFIGVFLFIVLQYVRIQYLYDNSYIFYVFLIIILIITFIFGVKKGGATSWLQIGSISFQPSEFGKLLFICFLTRLFSDISKKTSIFFYSLIIVLSILLPLILLIIQPDLGTAIAYLSIILPLMYWTGIRTIFLFLFISPIISLIIGIPLMPFSIFLLWLSILILILVYAIKLDKILYYVTAVINFVLNICICAISHFLFPYFWDGFLKEHQRERVITFLNPLSDKFGAGLQVFQSRISIGSGGFWGKGWKSGTQAENKFLPVSDSDFILSTLAEEFGFISILFIVLCLFYFIYWCMIYAQKVENKFTSLLIVGFASMIFMHIVINLGMISGILPVTGLPAPFISYGGSFFLTCVIMVGLINNISNNNI